MKEYATEKQVIFKVNYKRDLRDKHVNITILSVLVNGIELCIDDIDTDNKDGLSFLTELASEITGIESII